MCILQSLRVLSCIETLVGHATCRCLEGLMAAAFVSSRLLDLLRLLGVSAPSLHDTRTNFVLGRLKKKD